MSCGASSLEGKAGVNIVTEGFRLYKKDADREDSSSVMVMRPINVVNDESS